LIARVIIEAASTPDGSVTHRKNPPFGLGHVTVSPISRRSACSITSRLCA